MANIGDDISREELHRQFRDAVERLAEMRADLDQATQEVTRLREELKTTRGWAENFAHTAADNGAARDRYKAELEEARESRQAAENFYKQAQNSEALLQQEQETIRALEDVAVRHGYDMETGECLVDWLEKQLKDLRMLTEGIFGIHDPDATLSEVKKILRDRKTEKRRRVYYQDIVYDICNTLDPKRPVGKKIVCGTIEEPSTETQDEVRELMKLYGMAVDGGCGAIRQRDELKAERDQLQAAVDHWKKKFNEKVYANE